MLLGCADGVSQIEVPHFPRVRMDRWMDGFTPKKPIGVLEFAWVSREVPYTLHVYTPYHINMYITFNWNALNIHYR